MDTHIQQFPILSLLIWLPIISAALILLVSRQSFASENKPNPNVSCLIAIISVSISLALSMPLYLGFNNHLYSMQFSENLAWIHLLNIHYGLGIDGISLALVLLTNITGFIIVIAACQSIHHKVSQYMAILLLLQGLSIGLFVATDAMLFYTFWEAILIPMYLCIGIWGDSNRHYAATKLFIYTFLGSLLMLVAIIYLAACAHSFKITDFYHLHLPIKIQIPIFLAFLLAFAVKVPLWPLHTWLPEAHTSAPAGGSVILAALMLKMGIYGLLRFSLPITPDACWVLRNLMIALSLIAIVYIGLIAIVQTDMKRLIAYSSIAHMGFAVLGCFMIYDIININHNIKDAYLCLEGGVVQMISHAFNTGALFLGVGILYDKLHTRTISDYGGIAQKMPILAAFFMLFSMSNIGLPGTSGFVGEFMIILSVLQSHFWLAVMATTTLILSASYTLWLYKRVFYGAIKNDNIHTMTDINKTQTFIYILLAMGVLFIGIYPGWLLNILHSSVNHLLSLSIQHRL